MPDETPDERTESQPEAATSPDAPTGRPCSQCGKPAIVKFRPFCSKRCADIDLSRWLNGVYAIPASETEEDEESEDNEI